jgi:hypothetical protein
MRRRASGIWRARRLDTVSAMPSRRAPSARMWAWCSSGKITSWPGHSDSQSSEAIVNLLGHKIDYHSQHRLSQPRGTARREARGAAEHSALRHTCRHPDAAQGGGGRRGALARKGASIVARSSCSQNGCLSSRGGCQKRWHSLVSCDHGDSTTSRSDSPPGTPPTPRARRRPSTPACSQHRGEPSARTAGGALPDSQSLLSAPGCTNRPVCELAWQD